MWQCPESSASPGVVDLGVASFHMFLSNQNPASRIVLVLCGLPGCGKSIFAKNLCQESNSRSSSGPDGGRWTALNQDALKSRNCVYRKAEEALINGNHVVIDRCNFDVAQRSHWINLANRKGDHTLPIALMLPDYLNIEVCETRVYQRRDSIHNRDANWHAVCVGMARDFVLPTLEEGFFHVVQCERSDQLDAVRGNLADFFAH